ncbi:MAG: hypothetical protein KDD73_09905 [Anaerolineales bacterium]|nr:hypothetical protein [Anaerolineales bacterium]MCB9126673.1 hypothetical protein [Ardenticatenales bacterium]MCB9171787.1 hypothetical protein [Ardenticatenales bacterium]
MVKLLMTWNIKPEHETEYLSFINHHFTPGMMQLGLEPTEAWYTYWGDGPQITMSFVAESLDRAKAVVRDPQWAIYLDQLAEHVSDIQYKVIPAFGTFQI